MMDPYVIADTEGGPWRLYCGDRYGYRPWIIHAFTGDLVHAVLYDSLERARADCGRFAKTKFEFDGNTPLKPGRLKVMKIALVPVEQGG